MKKHTLQLSNNRLNADYAPECALHVLLGTESLSLMATHSDGELLALDTWEYSNAHKPFEQVEQEARQIFQETPIFKLPFKTKYVALFHPNTTLVPRRLFQHAALPGYFKLMLKSTDLVFGYDELPEFDAYLVYATEKSQGALFSRFFPEAKIRHLAVPMLRYFRSLAGLESHIIFVNLRHQVAQILVFERQNLLLYNTFQFTTATDLLYYVLLAYDQFRLSPKEIPLTLSGNIIKESELYQNLYRFIREIRFATPPVEYKFPADMAPLPGHYPLDLICLNTP